MEQLRQFVVFADEGGPCDTQRTQLTPPGASLAMKSPLLKPLSPPPADAEVQQLEAEVTAASLRVAELRTGMQSRLQGMLAAKLAACRPTAELEAEAAAGQPQGMEVAGGESEQARQQDGAGPAEGEQQQLRDGAGAASQAAEEPAAGQGEGGQQAEAMDSDGGEAPAAAQPAPAIPLSPQPQELQQRLLQAANRMPALRARLEQAADKLQRVVAAVAADINRPPPNTVERAVLGKTPGRPAEAAAAEVGAAEENEPGVSPLVKQVRAALPGLHVLRLGSHQHACAHACSQGQALLPSHKGPHASRSPVICGACRRWSLARSARGGAWPATCSPCRTTASRSEQPSGTGTGAGTLHHPCAAPTLLAEVPQGCTLTD